MAYNRYILALSAFGLLIGSGTQARAANDEAVEEVVVTAQRRAESLQKSSLAISVLTSEAIDKAGITDVNNLTNALPGVQVATPGQVFIRGVGDYGAVAINNPAVAFNVNGIYVARPLALTGSLFDIERIEVLKGPQGTLYGRNASGGAINFITARPKLGETSGQVSVEGGNYGKLSSDGWLNLAPSSVLALRGSYQVTRRDGYLNTGGNDDLHESVRVQGLLQPSDRFSVLLYTSYSHASGRGRGYALMDPTGPYAGIDPWTGISGAEGNVLLQSGVPNPLPPVPGATPANWLSPLDPAKERQDLRFVTASAEIQADLGFADLTIIPGYQWADLDYSINPAMFYETRAPNGDNETSDAFSLEARLSKNTERLKWVAGLYYYNESQNVVARSSQGFVADTLAFGTIDTKSYAAFGQATLSLTKWLRAIGGIRFTRDTRALTGELFGIAPSANCLPLLGTPSCFLSPLGGHLKNHRVNWKAGAELDLTDNNMLFVTAATGFKAGTVSLGVAAPAMPESLLNFELGLRNRFLDNRLQVNLEGFYIDYKGHQEIVVGIDDIGTVTPLVRNAGKARSYGAGVDVQYRVTPTDRLGFNVERLWTEYTNFQYLAPLLAIAGKIGDCAVTPTGGVGPLGPIGNVDCSGFPMPNAPEWAGTASYAHDFVLKSSAVVTLTADMTFATARWLTAEYVRKASGYVMGNVNVEYISPSGKWSVFAYVRNIGDEAVYTGAAQNQYSSTSLVGGIIAPPRTYGLRVTSRF